MSNVVSLRRHGLGGLEPAIPALGDLFSTRRRHRQDPFWLKENAELAQILAATGATDVDLSPLAPFVGEMVDEIRFFPQYYRLYLSLAVDLAALGMPGVPVDDLVAFAVENDLGGIELSDMHRAEVALLLRRAGLEAETDAALAARLWAFARRPGGFCLPNRRAAYDLTHIVFHAADYGRKVLPADPQLRVNLIHAGMVAWLEDNLDLLSEVVIALRLSGHQAPEAWVRAVTRGAAEADFAPGHEGARFDDDYHQYLVANWAACVLGGPSFVLGVPGNARLIHQRRAASPALRELSYALLEMGAERSGDWSHMRWRLWPKLSDASRTRVGALENMQEFGEFFAGFARAGRGRAVS